MNPKDNEGDTTARRHDKAARGATSGRGADVSVDELVKMGRTVMDRVKPYVNRAIARVKSTLNR